MGSNLIHYDEAKRALAACVEVDDVLQIRDKMEALRVYGRQINDLQLEQNAAAVKQRAMRRYDELTKELRKRGKLPGGKGGRPTKAQRENRQGTLSVSRHQQGEAHRLGALTEEAFEGALAEQIDAGRVPTIEGTLEAAQPAEVVSMEVKRRNRADQTCQRLCAALEALDRAVAGMSMEALQEASPAVRERLARWCYDYVEDDLSPVGRWLSRLNLEVDSDVG